MKRFFLILAAALLMASCGTADKLTKYDDAHFAALQERIDNHTTPDNVKCYFTEATDLNLAGKILDGTPNPYARVDTIKYKGFTASENRQVRSSAGLMVLFKTNSSVITVKTKWGQLYNAANTMPLAYGGYDLYIKDSKGEWTWAGACDAKQGKDDQEVVVVRNMERKMHECILYLPMYSEIYSCKIGVEEGSTIEPLEGAFRHRILFHGSSFTQGISISRAGMAYPLQFMRHTGLQVLPLGCSGNSKMQQYFADVFVDVDADAYVFDSFSNPNYKLIKERLIPFIDRLVAAHPGKPIIFQQTIRREHRNFNKYTDAIEQAKMDMVTTLFHDILKNPKYKDVYLVFPDACAPGSHEYSVDGTHPDDHGYYLWATSIEKPILKILKKYGIQ